MDADLYGLLAPAVAPLGVELVDVERRATLLRLVIDRPGGIDLDAIAEATKVLSAVLDEHDPFPGHRYSLEVSSPGIERPLRTPQHFAKAEGQTVSVRTVGGGEGERRFTGRLATVDDNGFVLEGAELPEGQKRFTYDEVQRARTVFNFGTAPAPSRKKGAAMRAGTKGVAHGKADRKKVTTP